MTKWIFVFLLLCFIATPHSVRAQAPENSEAQLIIPPNRDGPTQVFIDLGLRDVTGINESEETFEIDANLAAWWQDDRLAFDPALFGDTEKVYQGEVALEKLKTEIWWPDFEIVDSRGPRDRMHIELRVLDDGFVFYRERLGYLSHNPFC